MSVEQGGYQLIPLLEPVAAGEVLIERVEQPIAQFNEKIPPANRVGPPPVIVNSPDIENPDDRERMISQMD